MTLEERKEKAYACFKSGKNCAQAVACAFADVAGTDEKMLDKAASAFGAGFGRTRNLCGAVSACGLILGLSAPEDDGSVADRKAELYKQVQAIAKAFEERNGTTNCGQLLSNVKNLTQGYVPQVRDEEYYKVRPCLKFVLDAVELLHAQLTRNGIVSE